jgi:hypothetical protein
MLSKIKSYRVAQLLGAPFFLVLLRIAKRWKAAQKAAQPRVIPTYAANGLRLSDSSIERAKRLLRMGYAAARYDRRGNLRVIQCISDVGRDKLRATAHMGQHYASLQTLPSGARAWKHNKLIQDERLLETLFGEKPDNLKQADLFVRAIFRAVPISCMGRTKSEPPESGPAKVISIDAGRKRRTASPEETPQSEPAVAAKRVA